MVVKDFSKETDARIIIDDLLRQANWDPADKSQILTEVSVRDLQGRIGESSVPYGKRPLTDSDDGDAVSLGRADYVLLDQRGRPLAVVEAKRSAIQPVQLVRAPSALPAQRESARHWCLRLAQLPRE